MSLEVTVRIQVWGNYCGDTCCYYKEVDSDDELERKKVMLGDIANG